MRRFRHAAANLATALAAAGLAALGTTQAAAQDDPFALPRDVSIATARQADGPGLSPIVINGQEFPRLVHLKWLGTRLAIDADAARAAGLPLDDMAQGWITLDTLAIASWHFDPLNQQLTVKLFRRGDGPNNIDMAGQAWEAGSRSDLPALLVDYDLTATLSSRSSGAAGFIAPRFVKGNFALQGAFQASSRATPGSSHLIRLETAAQMTLPASSVTVTVGDTISAGTGSQRTFRMGGLQIGSDFALRPDLITTPLPTFSGNVAVPTGIDLLVNDQRLAPQQVEAGDFTLRNIPVSPGRGEFSVVVQDALGRETVRSAQVYVSQDMLAPGLWHYGANIGWVRRRFGTVSQDYGPLAATFFARKGLSRNLSLGLSGESGQGLWNLGIDGQATIGGLAMAFAELRVSRAGAQSGNLVRAGLESSGRGLSGRLEMVLPSPGYHDLAAQAGDPLLDRQFNATASFDLRTTLKLQVAGSRRWRDADPRFPLRDLRTDIARVTLRSQIGDDININGDLTYRRSAGQTSVAAMVGLSWRIGAKRSLQAAVTRRNGAIRGQIGVARPDVVPGDIGYSVTGAAGGGDERLSGAIAWRSRLGRLQAEAETNNGSMAIRGNVRGTVIVAGGQVFARNQTGGAYALVSTGRVGGVTVTREHAAVGKTNRRGYLLVENVTALVPVQFDIDADVLPTEAVARSTYHRVVATRGGIARVRLDVTAFRSIPLRLTGPTGVPLPIGLMLQGRDTGDRYMVGYDGLIDFNALSADTAIVAANGSWQGCTLAIPDGLADQSAAVELRTSCAAQLLVSK
jgi:outer membrane usher protein FimD/PapC